MIPYIIKALQTEDSVFVNDLGTFTKHFEHARMVGDTIEPPHYKVTLTCADGQPDETGFVNLICREKQCLITKASAEISQWVNSLKNALEHNKSICFEGFGTFSNDEKGNIDFECDHIDDLNWEFDGMSIVHVGATPSLEEEEPVTEPEPVIYRVPEPEPQVVEPVVEDVPPVEETTVEPEPEPAIYRVPEPEPQVVEPVVEDVPPVEETTIEPEPEPVIYRVPELEPQVVEPVVEDVPPVEETTVEPEPEPVIYRVPEPEPQVVEPVVEDVPPVEKTTVEPEPEEITSDSTEEENIEEQSDLEETDDDEPSEPRKKRSLWWLFLLIILIVLGTLAFLFRDWVTSTYGQLKERIFNKEEVIAPEEQQATEETAAPYEEVEEAESEIEEAVPYTPEVIKRSANDKYPYIRFESGHFYAIAGSLPNESDALLHIRQKGLDQYEPKLLLQDGVSNIRVCIGVFDTEEEAENFAKGINAKYWVLK